MESPLSAEKKPKKKQKNPLAALYYGATSTQGVALMAEPSRCRIEEVPCTKQSAPPRGEEPLDEGSEEILGMMSNPWYYPLLEE